MQVRPQRDWPRARSIQGLLQQWDGGVYAKSVNLCTVCVYLSLSAKVLTSEVVTEAKDMIRS